MTRHLLAGALLAIAHSAAAQTPAPPASDATSSAFWPGRIRATVPCRTLLTYLVPSGRMARPSLPASVECSGIPTAASMTYDSKRNRLVIPMNDWNAITIVDLNAPIGR